MSLASEARQVPTRRPPCTVGQVLDTDLGPELAEALADPTVTAEALATVLRRRGVNIQAQTLNRHRRGRCRCDSR